MAHRMDLNLGDVQKTLFLPLWGRAVETNRPNPLLVDETAVEIIDQIDYDFSRAAQSLDDLTKIGWIQWSLICDEVTQRFLTRYPEGTVVNIGCGLDTTFERVDNGAVRWYDLDLADVVELRRRFIEESERRRFIAASFLEEGWLSDFEVDGNALFIAAGVFYYLDEKRMRGFLLCLIDSFPGSEILLDVSSPNWGEDSQSEGDRELRPG